MADETQIRTLIERWAAAVHAGDLDTVLADHAEDIVMFDVPPPENGVRGIDAYRDTWPPFFEWQASGASFEIVELNVTAGRGRRLRVCAAPVRYVGRARGRSGESAPPHSWPAQGGRALGRRP